jgi:hypothetical protein
MPSQFALRIVHVPSGEYVEWAPGMLIESNLVEELANRVSVKKVGLLKTRAQVVEKVREAILELLYDLKKQVR